MLDRNIFISSILAFGFLFLGVSKANAATPPSFPSCLNPQGELKVQYTDGTHGIPGDTNTYNGSDAVYTLSDSALTQCFCAINGDGIQTNWWKVSSLTDSEVQVLRNQGWNYIPDGSLWGLEKDPYLTQNVNFSCQSNQNNQSSGSTGSSENGQASGTGGGQILASSTGQVLGLASTGNSLFILGLAIVGLVSSSLGLVLNSKKRR